MGEETSNNFFLTENINKKNLKKTWHSTSHCTVQNSSICFIKTILLSLDRDFKNSIKLETENSHTLPQVCFKYWG